MNPNEAIIECARRAGGQVKMASRLGVAQSSISRWMSGDRQLPAELVLTCERIYGVSRHDLRPDIYPADAPAAPPAWRGVDQGTDRVSFNRNAGLQADAQGRAA